MSSFSLFPSVVAPSTASADRHLRQQLHNPIVRHLTIYSYNCFFFLIDYENAYNFDIEEQQG